jgi:hypothetical protein
MFLLNSKLSKNIDILFAIKPIYSYGLYRRRMIALLTRQHVANQKDFYLSSTLSFIKYSLSIFANVEYDSTLVIINIELKKTLQLYQGL